jgi:hypothetical protein
MVENYWKLHCRYFLNFTGQISIDWLSISSLLNRRRWSGTMVDGKPRKTLVHFDRNGFAYALDRTDGTLLRAHKFVTVNWAEKVDLKTGRR